MTTLSKQARRLERLIIGVAFVVGAFLLFASISNFLASRRFAGLAVSGQADHDLFAAMQRYCKPPRIGAFVSKEELTKCLTLFFEDGRARGLRYVAVAYNPPSVGFRGLTSSEVFAQMGERRSPASFDVNNRYRGHPIQIEDLFYYALPPTLKNTQVPTMIFEFVPTQADSLRFLGWLTLLSGIVGALAVSCGSLFLVRLARQRESANQKAKEKEKLAALGQMSAVMAHELRNPLASAKGHSQLLVEMLESGSKVQRKAQQTVQELLRVEHLTNDLLDFIRSGKVHRSLTNPAQIVQRAIAQVDEHASLRLDDTQAPTQWPLDALALGRVLENLLRNALQAQGGVGLPIEVCLYQVGQELCISVRDHGPGFPEDLDILAPFVTTKPTGNGLGLAISEQIIKAHNGRIVLSNHPEQGALVELYLPDE